MLQWFYAAAEQRSRFSAPYERGRATYTERAAAEAAYAERLGVARQRGGQVAHVVLERFDVRMLPRMELLAAALSTSTALDYPNEVADEALRAALAPTGSWWSARTTERRWIACIPSTDKDQPA